MQNKELDFNGNRFDDVFDRYKHRVYGYTLSLCKSPYLAEEITQEIFIKIWQSRAELQRVSNLDAYLFRVVRNTTFNYLRNIASHERILNTIKTYMSVTENNVDAAMTTLEYNRLLQNALKQLSPKRRLVYELSRDKGLSYVEIAEHLNLSRNTVKNHLISALHFIKVYLNNYGYGK